MRKTYQLKVEGKNPERLVESYKNEICFVILEKWRPKFGSLEFIKGIIGNGY